MKTVLIDNYDSFTYNLYQAVAELSGSEPVVVRNDERSWEEFRELRPDVVIISPGPGHPANARDFGICAQVIRELSVPILGVCLGHQGIGHVYGASIVHAPEPMHGRIDLIRHDGAGLFAGLPDLFEAVRYHSLVVSDPLPDCLAVTARNEGGLIMGLRHRSRPIHGVQFHPESICTSEGKKVLANFYRISAEHLGMAWAPAPPKPIARRDPVTGPKGVVRTKVLEGVPPASLLFREISTDAPHAFWLDCGKEDGWGGHFSFLGCPRAETKEVVRYFAGREQITVERGSQIEILNESIWVYLHRQLASRAVVTPDLPFDFNCGYVGYFGYEMKAECGGKAVHRSLHADCTFVFSDRQIVLDHQQNKTYLLWYDAEGGDQTQAEDWWAATERLFARLQPATPPDLAGGITTEFVPTLPREHYLENIGKCLDFIREGESYEICLTNRFSAGTTVDPLEYFEALRSINPAPYSAFLRLESLSIACSSPERFLRINQHGVVETKPIKGTAARGATPGEDETVRRKLAQDVKTRAENLMIVDLLRNDLGRVCEIGSVVVQKLMDVETYATAHQMVSTISGQLRPSATALDCLRQTFPGGSMTGAPKLRTLEIIDSLETEARGIYSGCLGFLALNGAADFNIVIRTAVFSEGDVYIGTGGAIVALSDPDKEWDEIVLKAKAPIKAFEVLAERASQLAGILATD